MKKTILTGFIAAGLLLSACSGAKEEEQGHVEMQGDIREKTASVDKAPQFLADKPEDMQIIYYAAAQNRELLESMPCYCGCGDSVGHKDNYDCFVHDNQEDGAVVWDDHGTKCQVCLEIAAKAVVDHQNGKSIAQIRAEVDRDYAEGYAEPTPTKMP